MLFKIIIEQFIVLPKITFELFLNTKGFNNIGSTILSKDSFGSDIINTDYYKRMKGNAPQIKKITWYQIGDRVFIEKDFDKNTKKLKLESFHENYIGLIIEVINSKYH